jgi:hypothetical protein
VAVSTEANGVTERTTSARFVVGISISCAWGEARAIISHDYLLAHPADAM